MPINDIDGKSHIMELKAAQLFNQSFKAKITPLVIYGLRGVHTHSRIESDFKKPGGRPACAWFMEKLRYLINDRKS